MDSDVNVAKSKAVNFCFQNIKYNAYLILFGIACQMTYVWEKSKCTDNGITMIQMIHTLSGAFIIFNVLSLLFMWCNTVFPKAVFWITYVINIAWYGGAVGIIMAAGGDK